MIVSPPWYAKIPKSPIANRLWRRDVIRQAWDSSKTRDYVKACCKDDVLFYFNGFYWTYDPRLPDGQKLLPFITFPFQDRAILEVEQAIVAPRDLVMYKSRDLGLSWICVGVFEKRWHFHKDETYLCVARKLDEVDSSNYPDALFPKIDRIHANLPDWMMPKGWVKRKHRLSGAFFNPETGCTINAAATTDDAAVGGRRTAILFDEFSRVEQGAELDFGTADVSPCRIFNFTAYGTGNHAYELMKHPYKYKLGLYWYMDPRKNKKLYRWDGSHQRMQYFEWNSETWNLDRVGPHQYGPEDADRVNFHSGNGFPDGKPFEFVKDGVMRSPVYDIEDVRRGNRRYMAINWDVDFQGSENKVYDTAMLTAYDRDLCVPPEWEGEIDVDVASGDFLGLKEVPGGPLRLWFDPLGEWPRSDLGFAAGADVAKGRGASNSCCSFANVDTSVKVAEYVTPFEREEVFAAKVVALCRKLLSHGDSPTFLAWERQGPGEDFGKAVKELGHYHVYFDGVEPGQDIKPGRTPGWFPNRTTIRALHGEYEMALRRRLFINRSSLAVQECDRYVDQNGDIRFIASSARGGTVATDMDVSGARDTHGDRVIADALCNRALKFQGGGSARELAKEKERDEKQHLSCTLAGRMAMANRMERRRGTVWA